MIEKRFTETERNCYYTPLVFDNQTQEELGTPKVVVLLNMFEDDVQIKDKKIEEQQAIIDQLNFAIDDLLSHTSCEEIKKENEQLRQKIKHCVYVDVDNENGCMNCKYDEGSICSILNCGTHDYLEGVSECGLKYWECKDE